MKKTILTGLVIFITSCINVPTFYNGKVLGNKFTNNSLELTIPNNWKVRGMGGHTILILQKKVAQNGIFAFPTVILEEGTIYANNFHTYFNNTWSLVKGSQEDYSMNGIYRTNNEIDSSDVNGIKFYSFETKIINKRFKIAEMLQMHYYFNIDTMYFHLSVSDYDKFENLKTDYKSLIESIKKK